MIFSPKEPLHIKRLKKLAEAMAVGTGIIMFWRGIWLLADTYLYPESPWVSAMISLFAGILILLLTRAFVKQFLWEIQDQELRAEKTMFEKIMMKR
jgi:Fuseless